ncbi:MAG TPA: transporter [Candidatus Angelobacter sp.]|nr:transporter [Candidatus Angelobacter sp.]
MIEFKRGRHIRRSLGKLFLLVQAVVLFSTSAIAQELEPRAYSASPTGANFVVLGFARSSGEVVFDPSIVVTDAHATIHSPVLGLGRTFGAFGRQALVTAALPYAYGRIDGKVGPQLQQASITRSGLADLRAKFSINLRGSPAQNPVEFAKSQHHSTIIAASMTFQVPTGQYGADKLINLGTNRWAFRPELGVSYPWKKFYFDFYAGAWFFTANSRFFPGHSFKEQNPLAGLQGHISYSIRPRLWIAFDGTWYDGGDSIVNGGPPTGRQNNTRAGVTGSLPLTKNQSVKISYSNGVTARVGTKFNTISAAWQFLWFDHSTGHK